MTNTVIRALRKCAGYETAATLQAQAAGEVGRQRAGRVDLGAQLAELWQPRVHLLEHRGRDPGILGQVDPAAVAHDELVERSSSRPRPGVRAGKSSASVQPGAGKRRAALGRLRRTS